MELDRRFDTVAFLPNNYEIAQRPTSALARARARVT